MSDHQDDTNKLQTLGDTFKLGIATWWKEAKKLAGTASQRYEITRLEKQLKEEYVHLGRIAEAPRGKKQEKELCLKQIAFLKEEIEALREEFDK